MRRLARPLRPEGYGGSNPPPTASFAPTGHIYRATGRGGATGLDAVTNLRTKPGTRPARLNECARGNGHCALTHTPSGRSKHRVGPLSKDMLPVSVFPAERMRPSAPSAPSASGPEPIHASQGKQSGAAVCSERYSLSSAASLVLVTVMETRRWVTKKPHPEGWLQNLAFSAIKPTKSRLIALCLLAPGGSCWSRGCAGTSKALGIAVPWAFFVPGFCNPAFTCGP